MARVRIKLDKRDQYRPLLTDTQPGDVPVIFTNDGLYLNSHTIGYFPTFKGKNLLQTFYDNFLTLKDNGMWLDPYCYYIRKQGDLSLRTLSLCHPSAQVGWCDFYRDFTDAVLFYCSKSRFSIRRPFRISNSYFATDSDKSSHYKEHDIDTIRDELDKRYASSYFSYSGYRRPYKFFQSQSFMKLEKQYRSMMIIDITRCFDSIYTHTIGWAVLGKDVSKTDTSHTNAIGRRLDKLMQRSNSGVTNGIPIGAETSRVFAEIILQRIDVEIETELLNNHNFRHKTDYVIQRYVDDYYVFANSANDCNKVSSVISKHLQKFSLYINEGKKDELSRPFSTARSRITRKATGEIERLEDSIGSLSDDGRLLNPKHISRYKIVKGFVGRVREMCGDSDADYSSVSGFLIGVFQKRVAKICSTDYKNGFLVENQIAIRNNLLIYVELSFYYFFVDPQVSSSGRLARSIMLSDRFIQENLPDQLDFFRSFVSENTADLVKKLSNEGAPHTSKIEILNVILASSEFSENYMLPTHLLKKATDFDANINYFELAAILHYIRDHSVYDNLRSEIELYLKDKLHTNINDLPSSSEHAHLFLDSIGCPFLSENARLELLNSYLDNFEKAWAKKLAGQEKLKMLKKLQDRYWFVKWKGLDLVKVLERQELKSAY